MVWAEYRLNVNQIKGHPFFYGADWNCLRQIDPPFVPHLQSSTDTSYFPTEELCDTPDQIQRVEGVSTEKDLAFLGYVAHFFMSNGSSLTFLVKIHFQALHWWSSGFWVMTRGSTCIAFFE